MPRIYSQWGAQQLARAALRERLRTRVQVCMASKHAVVPRQYAESDLVRRHDVALYVRVGLPHVLRIAIQWFTCVRILTQIMRV